MSISKKNVIVVFRIIISVVLILGLIILALFFSIVWLNLIGRGKRILPLIYLHLK